MPTFSPDQLRELSVKMFKAVGASDEQADIVPEILVDTSLFGIDSHGVRAVPGHVSSLKRGRIRPDAEITVLKDTLTTALWSSLHQFDHVVGKKAMETRALGRKGAVEDRKWILPDSDEARDRRGVEREYLRGAGAKALEQRIQVSQ